MSGIIKHEMGLKFIFGGKSFVTFLNTNTSNRFTYKVVKHKTDDIYFINVLTSPDTYTFFGTYRNGQFKHSPKARISADRARLKNDGTNDVTRINPNLNFVSFSLALQANFNACAIMITAIIEEKIENRPNEML